MLLNTYKTSKVNYYSFNLSNKSDNSCPQASAVSVFTVILPVKFQRPEEPGTNFQALRMELSGCFVRYGN